MVVTPGLFNVDGVALNPEALITEAWLGLAMACAVLAVVVCSIVGEGKIIVCLVWV